MTRVRAAAHVHSTWSYDGRCTLEEIAATFARLGYQAVLMTEHDRGYDDARWRAYQHACAAASTPGLLVVPGMEYSDAENAVHVGVWGRLPFLGEGLATLDLLERAAALGATTVLAHPSRRDVWRGVGEQWLSLLSGVEIWNRQYDGWAPSWSAQELQRRRPALQSFVGLDFHTRRQLFPLAMTAELPGVLSVETVYAALAAGEFRPRALGVSAQRTVAGPGRAATHTAEHARRRAVRAARRAGVLR